MAYLSPEQLKEVDHCFDWVCEHIRIDNISPKKVLFGSTVHSWFLAKDGVIKSPKIVLACFPPNSTYTMIYEEYNREACEGDIMT